MPDACDREAGILLVAAETVADGKAVVKAHGFSNAMALGRVRIVTEPHGLRGWRVGTPVLVTVVAIGKQPGAQGRGHACVSEEMLLVLDAYAHAGRLRPVDAIEAVDFLRGVMG